ncbi:MAG: hypothetical protein MPEBLZ_02866 [Candidatus Methanoperedens nitroreducens]|uniref:Uncharacterized protein n=1 Tax=Candidatus Methanoperedens nitratireducens TaxID=1392998 RepID=A0A0N8KQM8_9EURY|nr:MAG: hypothetical protein MPEBLZ_02866 [Candidatus Methanoperedens sp. BLZ1]
MFKGFESLIIDGVSFSCGALVSVRIKMKFICSYDIIDYKKSLMQINAAISIHVDFNLL